ARRQDAPGLHSRPAVRLRQTHGRRVSAVRGRPVRARGGHGRAAHRRVARGVRAGELEGRAGGGVQPRDAPEADHFERAHSPAGVYRGGRAGGRGSLVKQPSLWHVLQPKWRTALQRMREERSRGGSGKLLLLVTVGLLFWVGVYGVLYLILRYFRGVDEVGPLLAAKLLGLVLLAFIAILVLSNVITALSSFFLAKDLDLLVAAPVDWLRIYLAKLGETLLHSSWMVA